MNKGEKQMLKILVESNQGFRDDFSLDQGQKKIIQSLISKELAEDFQYRNITCYRATGKGVAFNHSLSKKIWFAIKSDVRTITISVIVAIITTIITILVTNSYGK